MHLIEQWETFGTPCGCDTTFRALAEVPFSIYVGSNAKLCCFFVRTLSTRVNFDLKANVCDACGCQGCRVFFVKQTDTSRVARDNEGIILVGRVGYFQYNRAISRNVAWSGIQFRRGGRATEGRISAQSPPLPDFFV